MGNIGRGLPDSHLYPGALEHQRLLRGIAGYYTDDPRVLAVAVFGSLGRGTWDAHSDLDLDVVVGDGVSIDVPAEVGRLCRALGQPPAIIVPDREDAADVVLASLMQFSIRYHPLATTSPNIVDSLMVLTGRLDAATIQAAGRANRQAPRLSNAALVGACVRMAVIAGGNLQRRKRWLAYSALYATREMLLTLIARGHGAVRPHHALEVADASVRARFTRTLPAGDLASMQRAFLHLLDLLEHDLEELTMGQARLTDAQRQVVGQLRVRQAILDVRAE